MVAGTDSRRLRLLPQPHLQIFSVLCRKPRGHFFLNTPQSRSNVYNHLLLSLKLAHLLPPCSEQAVYEERFGANLERVRLERSTASIQLLLRLLEPLLKFLDICQCRLGPALDHGDVTLSLVSFIDPCLVA